MQEECSVHLAGFPSQTAAPVLEETPCKKCGVLGMHVLKPGTPPHAFELRCQACNAHLRWVSARSPADQAAQRLYHRTAALAAKEPTGKQLDFLSMLGFSGVVSSCLSASVEISALLQQGRVS